MNKLTNLITYKIFIIITLVLSVHIQAKNTTAIKAEEINELISRYTNYDKFNGSILDAEHGKVIYKKGYGMANMEWVAQTIKNL